MLPLKMLLVITYPDYFLLIPADEPGVRRNK